MNVIIAGATGLVGSAIVSKLLANDEITKVYIIGRRNVKFSSQKLEFINSDLLNFNRFPDDVDVAVCCVGTTMKKAGSKEMFRHVDVDLVSSFARACKAQKIEVFSFVSALGANINSKLFYNRCKGEVEKNLRKTGFECLRVYRPSLLIGDRQEFRFGESLGIHLFRLLKWLPSSDVLGTEVKVLSEVIVSDILGPKSSGFKVISKFQ